VAPSFSSPWQRAKRNYEFSSIGLSVLELNEGTVSRSWSSWTTPNASSMDQSLRSPSFERRESHSRSSSRVSWPTLSPETFNPSGPMALNDDHRAFPLTRRGRIGRPSRSTSDTLVDHTFKSEHELKRGSIGYNHSFYPSRLSEEPLQEKSTSLRSIDTISISGMGRRSGPRV
jgi:hypothetical protein